jgi:hypothetical protein
LFVPFVLAGLGDGPVNQGETEGLQHSESGDEVDHQRDHGLIPPRFQTSQALMPTMQAQTMSATIALRPIIGSPG